MDQIYQQLKKYGKVKLNQPLSKHTTFKIGGPARFLVIVEENDKLVALLNFLTGEGVDYFILGGGSNLLMPDQDNDLVIIKISTKNLEVDQNVIMVDSGVPLAMVVATASQNSLTGMEWGVGIPGTIGGAVRGNAGAMGNSISDNLIEVDVWQDSEVLKLKNQDCKFGYRDSLFKHNGSVVLKVKFKLKIGEKQEIMNVMQQHIKQRICRVPGEPSPGCFFKNFRLEDWSGDKSSLPESFIKYGKVSAGWLIEQSGCKGLKKGGAELSDLHNNTIINTNNATQADVLALVEEIKSKVYNKFGVELDNEVQVVQS